MNNLDVQNQTINMRILPILYSLVAVVLLSGNIYAQTIAPESVPATVKTKFNEKFPGAIMPQWKQEAPGFVDVSFTFDKKKYSATFAGYGDWVSTTQYMKPEELPLTIKEYLFKEYPKGKTTSAGLTETKKEKTYEVTVKNAGQSMELVFDLDGKLKLKEKVE